MKPSLKISAAIFALTLMATPFTSLQAQTTEKPTIKITDSKLHPINYGIDSLDHWVEKAKTGDAARAKTLLRDLGKLEVRFGRIPVSDSDQYKHVSNRLKETRAAIEAKSSTATGTDKSEASKPREKPTAKTNPELINISRLLSGIQNDIPRYQDNHKQRSRMRNDLATAKKRFERVPVSSHPDYQTVKDQLASIEAALQPDGDLKMDAKQVAEYVESIRVKYSKQVLLPEARGIMKTRELTAADVDGIVAKLKAFGENADQDLPKLRQVVAATGKGDYWLRWLEKDSIEKLKRNMESIKQAIDKRIDSGLRNAKQRSSLDPEKNKYAFTTESVRTSHEAEHGRTLRTIQQAARLEKLLELPVTWSPKINEMQDYIATYNVKAKAASTVRELPAEVGAKEHHKIAEGVFKIEKYGIGKIVRTIVNSKPVPRDRIEHKARSGKLETIVREWKEFQVTTVEQEGDKLFVYVNNLANFSRAPGTTPINQWILKQRYKRGEISKEDFSTSQN
jgi:hypothetical protein